jgi:hypothetical protein
MGEDPEMKRLAAELWDRFGGANWNAKVRSYVDAGRQLKASTTDELLKCWRHLGKQIVADVGGADASDRLLFLDIGTELELRGQPMPLHAGDADDIKIFTEICIRIASELSSDTSTRMAAQHELRSYIEKHMPK